MKKKVDNSLNSVNKNGIEKISTEIIQKKMYRFFENEMPCCMENGGKATEQNDWIWRNEWF